MYVKKFTIIFLANIYFQLYKLILVNFEALLLLLNKKIYE